MVMPSVKNRALVRLYGKECIADEDVRVPGVSGLRLHEAFRRGENQAQFASSAKKRAMLLAWPPA
jgi:hypothetical protein